MMKIEAMHGRVRPVVANDGGGASIGRILLDSGKISVADAERALQLQREEGLRFGEAAVKLGLVAEEDVRQALARQFDYPYLAAGQGGVSAELIAAYQPFSLPVEGLRALRTQLMLRWFGANRRALALLGMKDGDGCSFHAANLAVVFSQLGERTLLIDANLRTPRQHEIFKLGHRPGLSELLAGRADERVITRIDSFVDLSVVTAGAPPPNPMELLTRNTLRQCLDEFAADYDVILIDTPPASQCADSQTVAIHAGGALLVARENRTGLADLERVKGALDQARAEIVGAVLNRY
jgi:chain length determinant protein tyrosine kinase EpsG